MSTPGLQIVNLSVQVEYAPTPPALQGSGAIVSAGGTTLAANASIFAPTLAAGLAVVTAAHASAAVAYSASLVTVTVPTMTLAVGQTFSTIVTLGSDLNYDGTYVATVVTSTTFSYTPSATPSASSGTATVTLPGAGFVTQALTEFFAQGNNQGVYILELGADAGYSATVTNLETYITNYSTTPQVYYAYLLDPLIDATESAALATLVALHANAEALTYFFTDTTVANMVAYSGSKSIMTLVPSPTAPAGAVNITGAFYQFLVNAPGPANVLAPMSYREMQAVKPWTLAGNGTTLSSIYTAKANVIVTGAEGGLSNLILSKGTLMDGSQASQWYGIDWYNVNVHQALAAAIIQGSNSTTPLLYSQAGINALLAIANKWGSSAVAFGCAASVVVTAVPYATYIAQNPNDYGNGIYNGLAATVTSQNGFISITFYITGVQF